MHNREKYIQRLRADIRVWERRINELEAKARLAGTKAIIEYQNNIDALQEQVRVARKKLNEINTSSEDAWHELGEGFIKAWDDIRESIQKVLSKF